MKPGKRSLAWARERAKLKVKFLGWGITECELKYPGCWGSHALGFAHARKRRHLKPHELSIVILACNPCHDILERKPEIEMHQIVNAIIARRKIFPKKSLRTVADLVTSMNPKTEK